MRGNAVAQAVYAYLFSSIVLFPHLLMSVESILLAAIPRILIPLC